MWRGPSNALRSWSTPKRKLEMLLSVDLWEAWYNGRAIKEVSASPAESTCPSGIYYCGHVREEASRDETASQPLLDTQAGAGEKREQG